MSPIPDFSSNELKTISDTLEERYSEVVEPQLADADVQIEKDNPARTACPTVFWRAREANMVIFKTGKERYRCQFFYDVHDVFGTGVDEFDDLPTCVSTLLQVQSDDERARNMSAD